MSFVQRQIDLTFALKRGTFAEGTNSLKISGLRCSARIENAGGIPGLPRLMLSVWGMTLSHMNRLATMGQTLQMGNRNSVTVEAGDADTGMTKVFQGDIVDAYIDISQPPQVAMQMQAFSTWNANIATTTPSGSSAQANVSDLIQTICAQAGIPFQNAGVTATLAKPVLWGTAGQQLIQVIRAADISWNGGEDGQVVIWPKNGNRGGTPVTVSAQTGMVGSPAFTQWGMFVKCVYNPAFKNGIQINLVSDVLQIPPGNWNVYAIHHSLDAQLPRGEWFTTLWALNPNAANSGVTPVQGT